MLIRILFTSYGKYYKSLLLFDGNLLIMLFSAFKPGDKFFPLNLNGVFELNDVDLFVTRKAIEGLLKIGKARAISFLNLNIRQL